MGKNTTYVRQLLSDGKIAGSMTESITAIGRDQIYFGVTVNPQRAKYLALCLAEPLCVHCGRELAECDADPCQHSPYGLQGRGPDAADYRGNDYGIDQVPDEIDAEPIRQEIMNHKYVLSVKAGGNHCPSCGHDIVEGHSVHINGATAEQRVDCNQCDATWYDEYALVGYQLETEEKTM